MQISSFRKEQFIQKNKQELGAAYDTLNWITSKKIKEATQERAGLIQRLGEQAVLGCKNTKVDCRRLSPGCERCTEGAWSCLFVHSRCNSRCFYCPSPQDEDLVPMTNTVPFTDVNDYVDYIQRMGFTGISFSGGEPLMVLDTTLSFLCAVKDACGERVHTWLYTNGKLANREILLQLKKAGLDEIRFDIGATGMALDTAKTAVEFIDTVTIEIPALPEEFQNMKSKIKEMHTAGIQFLNLHQLRVTPYNRSRLINRDYTFLHGARVTVLESELTALRLIDWIYQEGIDMPINYCSFVYKNRFQRAAARSKSAGFIKKPHEEITASGYIRALEIVGEEETLQKQIQMFQECDRDGQWAWGPKKDRLLVPSTLWPLMDFSKFQTIVSYAEAKILPNMTYRHYFVKIPLNSQRSLFVEKIPVCGKTELNQAQMQALLSVSNGETDHGPLLPESILPFEEIEKNLAEYF